MECTPENCNMVSVIVRQFCPTIGNFSNGVTYESINFGIHEKPTKEEFEAKLKELIDAQPLKELRTKRNTVLDQSDKYATIDYPHATPEKKQEWLDYRQALRDLPSVTEDPLNPVWPTIPTA
jgi:hypothetical protein